MTMATRRGIGGNGQGSMARGNTSSLADVLDLILEKGLVIDVFVRVSLVGIEILTIDARIVVAGVDTYLRFAEATNRLDLYAKGGKDLFELTESMTEGGARGKTRGALDAVGEKVSGMFGGRDDKDEEPAPRRRATRERPKERENDE
jgi:gas vesicle structural protein